MPAVSRQADDSRLTTTQAAQVARQDRQAFAQIPLQGGKLLVQMVGEPGARVVTELP